MQRAATVMTVGIICSHWVNLKLALRFHALLIDIVPWACAWALKAAFHQGLFFPIGPIWTRLSPMNQFFWSARLSSWIASNRPLFWPDWVPTNGPWRGGGGGGGDESRTFLARSTRFRGASMRKYAQVPAGTRQRPGRDKGTFRGPSDDQDDHGADGFWSATVFQHV